MNINNVGYRFTHGNSFRISRPKGSGDYLLLFLRTGAVFTLAGGEVETPPRSFILYRKGTPQFYRASGEQFVNDWLHFDLTPEEAQRIDDLGIPFDTPTSCENIAFFSGIIKSMYQEKYSVNPCKETTLALYFQLIITKLTEQIRLPALQIRAPHYEKLSQLRERIYNTPESAWTVDEMAEQTALSTSYFAHLYKKTFGVGAMADVIKARVERAQYLLSSTENAVGQVAAECGYKNEVHFMRQFKDEVGITPSAYRKQCLLSSKELRKGEQKAPYCL